MHNSFYASGFLYHPPSQQILLLPTNNTKDPSFCLFLGSGKSNEEAKTVFQQALLKQLGILIPLEHINPVYDYVDDAAGKNYFILYGTVADTERYAQNGATWLTNKQLLKAKLPEQVSHDIIVAQRVIRADDVVSQQT